MSLPVPLEVIVLYVGSSFLALLQWWLDRRMPCPAEEVDRMFRDLILPGLLVLGITAPGGA